MSDGAKMQELMSKPDFDHFHSTELIYRFDSGEEPSWTEDEEREVRRRIDWRVVPLVTVLYLLCFVGFFLSLFDCVTFWSI